MANDYRYAQEWTPWDDSTTVSATLDFNDDNHYAVGPPTFYGRGTNNTPHTTVQQGVMQTIDYVKEGGPTTNDGVYQIAVYNSAYRIRKRTGSIGMYNWGNWLSSGAAYTDLKQGSLANVPEGQTRLVAFSDLDDDDPVIAAPRSKPWPTLENDDLALVYDDTVAESLRAYISRWAGGTDTGYIANMFYQAAATESQGSSFGFRDLVAVGFEDTSDDEWLASGDNTIARAHYISNGITISDNTQVVDGFAYGQVFENRVLTDPVFELGVSCYLTDSEDRPPDNRIDGSTKMVELGLKNPSGDRLLIQLWGARATSINESLPEAQFAFSEYTYRATKMRLEVPSAAQIISFSTS